MDKHFLLIDFGASRIKTAIYNNKNLIDIKDFEPIKPYDVSDKKYVISLEGIKKLFNDIIDEYNKKYAVKGIYICSEMHGFALLDKNNKPVSDYISWKDERCLNCKNKQSSFDYLKSQYGEEFFLITGMKPRPCYPFFNLYEYLKNINIKEVKVVSLPEWICTIDGQSLNIAHETMSAGLGFYNIYNKTFDKKLTDIFYNKYGVKLLFNNVTDNVAVGGYINKNNFNIPVYTGVGDHQCAVLGAGNDENTISINLGTGSQVGMIGIQSQNSDKRPYFGNKLMSVVTHIPSGRSLNAYIGFLNDINPNLNFWKMLSDIKLEELLSASLDVDLAVFSSAWNFADFGKISGINEHNFTLKNYLASLLKCYLKQYETAIEYICSKEKILSQKTIILSGGIPLKIPTIQQYFINKGYKTLIKKNKHDETLNGLCIIVDKKGK